MKRFKNILVVYDSKTDNRALLNHALELATRNQAALKVVDVIEETFTLVKPGLRKPSSKTQNLEINISEEIPSKISIIQSSELSQKDKTSSDTLPDQLAIDVHDFMVQEEQRSLQQFVGEIQRAGIKVTSKTLYGISFIEIIREVLNYQHDLVMITAEGGEDIKEVRFGSTTMHLMRKCPCPVWVIKPSQQGNFKRILAAVDLVQDDEVRIALNTKIIELAASLARLGQSELTIVHAWRMIGESMIRGRGGFSAEQVGNLLQETKDSHRQLLIEFLQQHSLEDLKYEVFLLKGDAGTLIPELANTKAIELIVMGTVGRAGVAGLLIGNTAEKVLRQVDCSVLTVKPEGFITPVK